MTYPPPPPAQLSKCFSLSIFPCRFVWAGKISKCLLQGIGNVCYWPEVGPKVRQYSGQTGFWDIWIRQVGLLCSLGWKWRPCLVSWRIRFRESHLTVLGNSLFSQRLQGCQWHEDYGELFCSWVSKTPWGVRDLWGAQLTLEINKLNLNSWNQPLPHKTQSTLKCRATGDKSSRGIVCVF